MDVWREPGRKGERQGGLFTIIPSLFLSLPPSELVPPRWESPFAFESSNILTLLEESSSFPCESKDINTRYPQSGFFIFTY